MHAPRKENPLQKLESTKQPLLIFSHKAYQMPFLNNLSSLACERLVFHVPVLKSERRWLHSSRFCCSYTRMPSAPLTPTHFNTNPLHTTVPAPGSRWKHMGAYIFIVDAHQRWQSTIELQHMGAEHSPESFTITETWCHKWTLVSKIILTG